MIRSVVTGGGGFIGKHLLGKLDVSGGIEVVIHPVGYGIPSCARLFFLSTYGNMAHHQNNFQIVQANVEDVLRATVVWPGWFCYMSSSSVKLPVQTPYSRTKRAAEEILLALPELKSCIVRPYSVTGVGEQKEHLIPTLIRSCMTGEEMPFDPEPVHDFVDVSDIVDALIYAADNQITGIIELGSGVPRKNKEVLEVVEHICQAKANVRYQNALRPYDNEKWYCKNLPDWFEPKKPFYQSVSEMVEAYKA